jgi:hypothetical protein
MCVDGISFNMRPLPFLPFLLYAVASGRDKYPLRSVAFPQTARLCSSTAGYLWFSLDADEQLWILYHI